ncbi:hypothetical protein V8G54_026015 [Vigna mungo]|uniref:Uncharacterized protein n=1 Tax=Vigna mungo TaxID=3915 RepID=A0AAQ3N083_VIGMU
MLIGIFSQRPLDIRRRPSPRLTAYGAVSVTGSLISSATRRLTKLWLAPLSMRISIGFSPILPASFMVVGDVIPSAEHADSSMQSFSWDPSSIPPSSSSSANKSTLNPFSEQRWPGAKGPPHRKHRPSSRLFKYSG